MKKIKLITILLLIVAILTFRFHSLQAQQLFTVSQNILSQEKITHLTSQISNLKSQISYLTFTKNNENREVYSIPFSAGDDAQIILMNEQTSSHVVITPLTKSLSEIQLELFFLEELKQAALGDADFYLVMEIDSDFSVIHAASISTSNGDVYIPRYFYGKKENVKEAFPQDRQIKKIIQVKPQFISAFPDDPEHQRYITQLEEAMSYYVYMYALPDGTLCIHDQHFKPDNKKGKSRAGNNLVFDLSGDLTENQRFVTEFALEFWGEQLAGSVPVDICVDFYPLGPGVLGASYMTENFFNYETNTWYPSPLWNQLVGYDATSDEDIYIVMSSNFNFYFGLDGNAIGYDYITIMLHEVTHGLGMYSLCDEEGYFMYDGYNPGIYDRILFEGISGPCITELTPTQRAALIISHNLYAGGPQLLDANEGSRVKIYAPSVYSPGSSKSHWDQSVNNFQTFMKYAYAFPLHTFNTRKIGLLMDLGWTLPVYDPNTLFVSFHTNGGKGTMVKQQFHSGEPQTLRENIFTKSGCTYVNWNSSPDGNGVVYYDKENITLFSNLELYAQWQGKEYTLTFDPNGGQVNPNSMSVIYGESIGKLPIPQKDNNVFNEWRYGPVVIADHMIWNFASNITVLANWAHVSNITENHNKPSFTLIPNPASHSVELLFTNYALNQIQGRITDIEIFDVFGRKCEISNLKSLPNLIQGSNLKIDISHLPTGLYLVKVGNEAVKLVVTKFIAE